MHISLGDSENRDGRDLSSLTTPLTEKNWTKVRRLLTVIRYRLHNTKLEISNKYKINNDIF